MDPNAFHRELTAIMSADVAGYCRLMQDDEVATVKALEGKAFQFVESAR